MSRTDKDLPWSLGGQRHKYWIASTGHAAFKRQCRKAARMKARADMVRGRVPSPVYPVEREYFD